MRKTLLFETPEQKIERNKKDGQKDKDWERLRILHEICYEHYTSVDTKPDLAAFCRLIVTISDDFEGDEFSFMPRKGVDRLVGEITSKAVRFDLIRSSTGRTKVSNKAVFKSLVKSLVERAVKEGHSKNKTSQTENDTAFEVISNLLYKYGITNGGKKYSPSTISNWCEPKIK